MTSRQRFSLTLDFKRSDRIPLLEEGIREDVLDSWKISHHDLQQKISYDFHQMLTPSLDPIPHTIDFPRKHSELKRYFKRFNPTDPKRFSEEWPDQIKQCENTDCIRILRVHHGFFLSMGVEGWQDFVSLIDQIMENPGFVIDFMVRFGEFAARVFSLAAERLEIDAVYIIEPLGGKYGILIAPDLYETLVLASYQPLLSAVKTWGIKNIIFLTYSNIFRLIPKLLDRGISCLWVYETDAEEMDYLFLRKQFGRDLRLIGGIDLNILRQEKRKINEYLERNTQALLADGGYIPMLNGRVRTDIPLENYQYYRKLLNEIVTQ